MRGFSKCAVYLIVLGILSFFAGRVLPKRWFRYDRPPYRALALERGGALYDMIGIRRWKDALPDMSRLLPKLMPSKKLIAKPDVPQLELMLRETCVAEFIHLILCVAGFACVLLWPGPGGWIISIVYMLGNLPFCLIQRHNRPKLVRILDRLRARKGKLRKRESISAMKNVLILSCSTGQGHNSCALAVEEYFKKHGTNCETRDVLDFISPRMARVFSGGHSWVYRHVPGLFRWGYRYAEQHPAVFSEGSLVYRLLTAGTGRMREYIDYEEFDTVICTHVFSAMILTHMLKERPMDLRTAFIATDYTCSPSMEASDLEHYFIPDAALAGEYARRGIPAERITASGIPVRCEFLRHTDKSDAKRLLSIRPGHRHLLITCGSMGCGPIPKILRQISKALPPDAEVTVICGTNRRLEKRLSRRYAGGSRIHIVGYTRQMPLYLDSADLYLTKPGGMSVTEAAVKNTPMVFVNAVAGCESYNMKFFIDRGAAISAVSPKELAGESIRVLRSPDELMRMENAMQKYGRGSGSACIYQKLSGEAYAHRRAI